MFTALCAKVCSFAEGVSGFSFVNIWAYEPKKPSCLTAKRELSKEEKA